MQKGGGEIKTYQYNCGNEKYAMYNSKSENQPASHKPFETAVIVEYPSVGYK